MVIETVRLDGFCKITNWKRDPIVNMEKQAREPWAASEFQIGKHRRYDGAHALAMVLVEMLNKQGVQLAEAAEVVRNHQAVLSRFLDEIKKNRPGPALFVTAIFNCIEDSLIGTRWTPFYLGSTGTAEEVKDAFSSLLDATGKTKPGHGGKGTARQIGGPHMSLASIPEAYRLLKVRAEAAGYVIEGRRILRLAADADAVEA